jgi:hypothetical protein
MGRESVLIVGVSTRAFVDSARRAGFAPVSVDAFGDLDQKQDASNVGMRRDLGRAYGAAAAVAVGRRLEAQAAAYVANLENHPRAVARLARGRELLGNSGATLARARDFSTLAGIVRRAGAQVPTTLGPGEAAPPGRRWLRKPMRGGGGAGVRELAAGARVGAAELAQERIEGVLASVSFVADGRRAVLLGVAQGLAGDPAFGARGHRYCGSLYPLVVEPGLRSRLDDLAQAATRELGLVGLNGIDFVVRDGAAYVLELNPRYSASMELVERRDGLSAFGAHAAGCRGRLPAARSPGPSQGRGVVGKAVLWARRNVVLGETRRWLGRDDIRDVPFPGEHIRRGHPICTVLGQGDDAAECRRRLIETVGMLEAQLEPEPVSA